MLTNVMHKPLPAILHEFQKGTVSSEHATGDVKYHLGTSCDRETAHGTVSIGLRKVLRTFLGPSFIACQSFAS